MDERHEVPEHGFSNYGGELRIKYGTQDTVLVATQKFKRLYSSVPSDFRSHPVIVRLGVLSRQFYTPKDDLQIKCNDNGQTSFDEFDTTSRCELFEVAKLADEIRDHIGMDSDIVVDHGSFPNSVCDAVEAYNGDVFDAISQRREQAILKYCRQTGLYASPQTADSTRISQSKSVADHTESTVGNNDNSVVQNDHYL